METACTEAIVVATDTADTPGLRIGGADEMRPPLHRRCMFIASGITSGSIPNILGLAASEKIK